MADVVLVLFFLEGGRGGVFCLADVVGVRLDHSSEILP